MNFDKQFLDFERLEVSLLGISRPSYPLRTDSYETIYNANE